METGKLHSILPNRFLGTLRFSKINILWSLRFWTCHIFFCITLFFTSHIIAQDRDDVLLTFRYQGIDNIYINALYDYNSRQFYLPVHELFKTLEIYTNPRLQDRVIEGTWVRANQKFKLDLNLGHLDFGGQIFNLDQDDFRISELDLYLSPEVFENGFALKFIVNSMQLTLRLETNQKLPVQIKKQREEIRAGLLNKETGKEESNLLYNRKRKWIDGAMFDYQISVDRRNTNTGLTYNLGLGGELLGGDIQGRVFGNYSGAGLSNAQINNLFWRYAIRNQNLISRIMVGQLSTTGLDFRRFRGVSVSNEPVEPRRMFDGYNLDGYTEPESEVELFLNERLVQYSQADELGYYKFAVPLSYGSSRVRLRIYTPDGQIKDIDRQIQVPFTFLPKGVLQYEVQAGKLEPGFNQEAPEGFVSHGSVAYGLSNWISARIGTDYMTDDPFQTKPVVYGNISARIASQYLMSLDLAPQAFYRLNASVLDPSNKSINITYTRFNGRSVYNYRNLQEDFNANFFIPVQWNNFSLGFVVGVEHAVFQEFRSTRIRSDLSFRYGRLNARVNYRDAILSSGESYMAGEGQLTTAVTYNFVKSQHLPLFFHNLFMRGELVMDTKSRTLFHSDFQISKTFKQTGRGNISVGYNHYFKNFTFEAGLIIDFKKMRSVTSFRAMDQQFILRQTVSGSVSLDHESRYLAASNRDQVGRASASLLFFIDKNNTGKYDEGDELLPHKAFKMDRVVQSSIGKDSIIRISQMQPYHKYTLTINRNALPDPTLVPIHLSYTLIMDPNQFKRIEIPFYKGGIVEGTVYLEKGSEFLALGGLKLYIKGLESDFNQELRSFSNGFFYSMDIPPGKYRVEVDPAQLELLGAIQQNSENTFEITPKPGGDILDKMDVYLKKR